MPRCSQSARSNNSIDNLGSAIHVSDDRIRDDFSNRYCPQRPPIAVEPEWPHLPDSSSSGAWPCDRGQTGRDIRTLDQPAHAQAQRQTLTTQPNDRLTLLTMTSRGTMKTQTAMSTSLSSDEQRRDAVHASANTMHGSQFIDEKQLCADLRISSVTATKWRARAEGPPFIKVGRLVRYRRADVEAWLSARTFGLSPA